jgi:hypothetical protein
MLATKPLMEARVILMMPIPANNGVLAAPKV